MASRELRVRIELDRESAALLRLLGVVMNADPVMIPADVRQAALDALAVIEERRG